MLNKLQKFKQISVSSGQRVSTQPCRSNLWGMAKPGPNLKSSWANQAIFSHQSLLASGEAHHEMVQGDNRSTINQFPSLNRVILST